MLRDQYICIFFLSINAYYLTDILLHSCTDRMKMVYFEILPYFENYFYESNLGFWNKNSGIAGLLNLAKAQSL